VEGKPRHLAVHTPTKVPPPRVGNCVVFVIGVVLAGVIGAFRATGRASLLTYVGSRLGSVSFSFFTGTRGGGPVGLGGKASSSFAHLLCSWLGLKKEKVVVGGS